MSLSIEMSERNSRSAAKDASPRPSGTPHRPPYPPLPSSFTNPRRRDLDELRDAGLHKATSSANLGQFAFAPATRTTVVTTTTTTTTSFPPLVLKAPRSTRELDPKMYPLASSPTPASLRNIRFELGGRPVIFNEPEDTMGAFQEVSRLSVVMFQQVWLRAP
jgi:F-box and WD-40 domain protein CDC4